MLHPRVRRGAPFFWTALVCLVTTGAWAASPTLSVLLPRGGQRGTTVDVAIHGNNLEDAIDLLFHGPGITVSDLVPESPSKVNCKLTIASDCAVRTHRLRVRTKTGLTNMQLFSVGALPETQEAEPNNESDTAQVVGLGTTVNGVVESEDVDYYAVDLTAGARLAVEIEGLRLGTVLFDPKVRLFGPHGHELVTEDDTPIAAQDCAFVFTASEEGRHVVAVSEASYGGAGNYYYRLHLGQFPRPLMVTPLGGAAGATREVTWLGDPGIVGQSITLPSEPAGAWTIEAEGESGISPTPVPFRVSPFEGVVETEPNHDPATASKGAVPGSFDGIIQEPGDVDFFAFEAQKDQVYDLRLWARAMGSPLDSVVTVTKPDGQVLASDDDGAGLDSAFRVTIPEDGTYTLSVRDHRYRGGETFAYRVEAAPVERRLELRVLENEAVGMVVPQGNRALLLVQLVRQDFDGPIRLDFADMPEGVSAVAEEVPQGQTTWPVVLTASADAPPAGSLVDVVGRLDSGDPQNTLAGRLKQEVVLIKGANNVTFFATQTDRLAMAVTEPAPFSIEVTQPNVPLVRNGNIKLKVTATRREGFTAPIDLRIPWTPSGVGAGTAQIGEGVAETLISLDAQGNAPVTQAYVAVTASSAGFTVCSPFISLDVQEPWVTFDVPHVQTEQGKPVEVVVKVNQAKDYTGTSPCELLGLPRGISAPAQDLSSGITELRFPLTVAEDAPEGKHGGLFVRTVLQAEGEDILHQSGSGQVQVFKPLPPELQQPAPATEPQQGQDETPKRKTRFGQ